MNEQENIENKIIRLPDFIANQIAAGEVVQRPESVIKELVENSLDSGADTISVLVRDAGKSLIHVVDNGSGMSKHDLEMSIKRHATSKIREADDLEHILTYGFRGEALASISSVAHLEIRTKRHTDKAGWKLSAEPSKEPQIEPAAIDNGTQIFVKNLFYNVPGRRKFLRANLTEFRYISETMLKFALSRPDIRFIFYDGNELIFDLKPSNLKQRIIETQGKKTKDALISVSFENETLKVSGYIGEPDLARRSYSGQYLFLNKRPILSRSLNHSVYSAYEHLLEKNKKPLFILNLEINPERVDINVHPQKHEVKFDDERYIYNLLNDAVTKALKSENLVPEITISERAALNPFDTVDKPEDDDDFLVVNRETGEILEKDDNRKQAIPSSSFRKADFSHRGFEDRGRNKPLTDEELSAFDALFGKIESEEKKSKQAEVSTSVSYWQLHGRFIFKQTQDGFLVVDQIAAHRRILFEKALRSINTGKANSQDLLFPVRVELDSGRLAAMKEFEDDLTKLGFVYKISGESAVDLISVPADLSAGAEDKTFHEIIEELSESSKPGTSGSRERIAGAFARQAAIGSKELSPGEIDSLMDDLTKCDNPRVTFEGRPVMTRRTLADLEKLFRKK